MAENTIMHAVPQVQSDLTKEWFSKILSKREGGNVVIDSLEISRGTNPGDNYMSVMLVANIRAKLEGEEKVYNLMCKILPENPQLRAVVLKFGVFNRLTRANFDSAFIHILVMAEVAIVVPQVQADLTKEWFSKMLSKAEGANVVIDKLETKKGTNPGDNYMSVMLIANIEAKLEEKKKSYNLMCKILPENPQLRRVGLKLGVFDREINFYTKILPDVYKFQKKHLTKEEVIHFPVPRCYYAEVDENGAAIIMENMKAAGYTMLERMNGLDVEAVKLALIAAARWHAVTLQMDIEGEVTPEYESVKGDMEKFRNMQNDPENKAFMESMGKMGEAALELVKDMPIFDQVEGAIKKCFGDRQDLFEEHFADEKPFRTLNHGDLWVNNMLFKLQDNVPKEIMLVDWQIMRYTSPMIDINYLIYTSTTAEVRRPHLDEFLDIYYKEFCRVLKLFGTDPSVKYNYTKEAAKKEFIRRNPIGFLFGVFALQLMCAKDTFDMGQVDFESFVERRSKETKSGKNEIMKKRICDVIKDIYDAGSLPK